ncbi:hypothetical protein DICPUDRAFT_99447 [Dictyostelium purpureum]|uniref:Uncharacterized protein n=1 Tax=Dictyostelium purpureum TaxID=5786 RepID=F0ZZ94_DICPU|nr:uncharacterized protein DICPUDRAFT_99447 [Dictyostelium purpureum]EGC30727.1 hypothetical protein DICPUDRAFT_99447 [Dictyostelium purpureum]|eukprot:XP_003292738.1 hypothetical protein DICPUDRAFT_99447 [Dictyostelium purpureum]
MNNNNNNHIFNNINNYNMNNNNNTTVEELPKSINLKDLIKHLKKDIRNANLIANESIIENSLLDKEIRGNLFPILHKILLNTPKEIVSLKPHSTNKVNSNNSGNNSNSKSNSVSQGFLYLFDKSSSKLYLQDNIKWIKAKANVRMVIIDEQRGIYKLKTHKKDIGEPVLRRQTFNGICENGIFWRRYEYKLVRKELYNKVVLDDNNNHYSYNEDSNNGSDEEDTENSINERFIVQDWPIFVHYLTKPSSESIPNEQDSVKETITNNNSNKNSNNSSSNTNNSNTQPTPKKRDLSLNNIFGFLKKKKTDDNSNNNNNGFLDGTSPILQQHHNHFFNPSTPNIFIPNSPELSDTPNYLTDYSSIHSNVPNTSNNTPPISSERSSSNNILDENYILNFADNWTFSNLSSANLFPEIPNTVHNTISNDLNLQSLHQQQILATTTTTTTSTSSGTESSINIENLNNINNDLNNKNLNSNSITNNIDNNLITGINNENKNNDINNDNNNLNNENNNNNTNSNSPYIVSYSPDTSPALEQNKIICFVSGFKCFEKKTIMYTSFWAVFDGNLEILALPISKNVLEFTSPIYGEASICHFNIVCKENSSKRIIEQTPSVTFCFTPSDLSSKLKISFDRCKIQTPIAIIPKFRHSVKHLDLSNNSITNVDFLNGFYRLETLILHNNKLTEHIVFPILPTLQNLDLSSNKIMFPKPGSSNNIYTLFCFRLFQSAPSLLTLNLQNNEAYPLAPHHHYNYRIYIISKFQQLIKLDEQIVTEEERRHSDNIFDFN